MRASLWHKNSGCVEMIIQGVVWAIWSLSFKFASQSEEIGTTAKTIYGLGDKHFALLLLCLIGWKGRDSCKLRIRNQEAPISCCCQIPWTIAEFAEQHTSIAPQCMTQLWSLSIHCKESMRDNWLFGGEKNSKNKLSTCTSLLSHGLLYWIQYII